ncbi:MAG: DUF4082 domain-containing protein, partial [bacterium]|nr:DUF4082 domain-containing protein [bacterium]
GLREVEIATEADAEYSALHGNNPNAHIQGVLNMVNGFYADAGLVFQVTSQRFFTNAATDPYETCNIWGQWCEFFQEWELNRQGVHRDVAHLFSGKALYRSSGSGEIRTRGTSGIDDGSGNPVGTICNLSEAYVLSTDYREAGLVAHEIGHAFNAAHVSNACGNSLCPDCDCGLDTCTDTNTVGGPVMCGHIQNPTTAFDSSTVTTITNFVNTVSCLTQLPGGGPAVTPWQDNANGTQRLNVNWNYAMGYHFTPLVSGQVTELGGLFNGTKVVRLYNNATGTLLAQTTVSAANDWAYAPITPVNVQAGTTYTVAVYLAGTGGSYRYGITTLPQTYGQVRIEGTTYAATSSNPNARPTNTVTTYMYGQADVKFAP